MAGVEHLLQAVSEHQPCGEDLGFSAEMDAIARARQQDEPGLEQGEWVVALKEADWPFVAAQCAKLIQFRSKDLKLAVWYAEASARIGQFRGLGDGFALLEGLCARFWDGLHPLPEEGDVEQRIGNLAWLLGRLPQLVKGIPILEECREDAVYCQSALHALERAVDERLGAQGPSFAEAREALQRAVDSVLPLAANDSAPACVAPAASAFAADATHGGALHSRAHAIARLREVAEFFRRTEPHSPVAYLADKAARWGEMALHDWLREVVKDPGQLASLDELLGGGATIAP